eukprot:418523-Amphidinium_carterae.1
MGVAKPPQLLSKPVVLQLGGHKDVPLEELKLEIIHRFGSALALWVAEARRSSVSPTHGLTRASFQHAVRQVAPFIPTSQLDTLWVSARRRGQEELIYLPQFTALLGNPSYEALGALRAEALSSQRPKSPSREPRLPKRILGH